MMRNLQHSFLRLVHQKARMILTERSSAGARPCCSCTSTISQKQSNQELVAVHWHVLTSLGYAIYDKVVQVTIYWLQYSHYAFQYVFLANSLLHPLLIFGNKINHYKLHNHLTRLKHRTLKQTQHE